MLGFKAMLSDSVLCTPASAGQQSREAWSVSALLCWWHSALFINKTWGHQAVTEVTGLLWTYLHLDDLWFLLLNSDKTEINVFSPKKLTDSQTKHRISLDGFTSSYSTILRKLGVIFQQDLSCNSHVKQVSRAAFFHLQNITKNRSILSQS